MINLENAKKVAPEISKYKNKPGELFKMLDDEKESLSTYLEKLDPSDVDENGNKISQYDAFDRHCMAEGIVLNGMNQMTVAELYQQATYLMPDLTKREIQKGMDVSDRFSSKDLIAITVPFKGQTYSPLYIPDLDTESTAEKVKYGSGFKNEGAEFSKLTIRAREKSLRLKDYGMDIQMTYKVLKDYHFKDYAIVLNLVGAQMESYRLTDIYDLAITGDGTVGSADNVFEGTDGALAYLDLVHAYSKFNSPFTMNAMLCDIDTFETILSLSQFTDPQSGWKFQNNGTLVTPFGAIMKQVNSNNKVTVTAKETALIDRNFGVRCAKSQELMIESEKIINRKIESAVVSEEAVYSVIADGAFKQLEWHA